MNNKAKAKAKAQALAWLEEWKQRNPEKVMLRKQRVVLKAKVPAHSNKQVSVGKAINSVWQSVRNPSPQKTKLWGWHKA